MLLRWRRRWWVRRQSRQKPTVLHHILVMFGQCGAEKMTALRVSHKIKVVRLRRPQRRAQRGFARISNGPGGKPCMLVGIVKGIETKILPRQRSIVLSKPF